MHLVSIIGENLGAVDEELEYNSIEELAAIISTSNWAPGLFKERRRLIANLSQIDLLVLDVDAGCSLTDALQKFAEYKHIIATSRNHQKEKNGVVCDRFRVVLFLSESLTSDKDFKNTWARARKFYPFIDDACKDSSRFFYASPDVISVNSSGRAFEVSVAIEPSPTIAPKLAPADAQSPKGELWKSTLKFLLEGAPAGSRHTELVKAVGNMREQGYDQAETLDRLTKMSESADWTQPYLSPVDLKTVERMYARDLKYPYQPNPIQNLSPIIVKADELLDETFSYLADKDKVKGEPTGIQGLDALLGGGFRTGELTVLMAQAKTGKNTLYHYLIYKHLERGIPFGYASRELNPATEVVPNLLSIAMDTNAWTSDINADYQARARAVLSNWALYFAPGYGYFAPNEIETWMRTLKDHGINHFLFDHFHYSLQGEDYESTAQLIKKLKSLTKELDIHLSLIVQPRSLREGEALSLATLRGGAAIGQALDNLLILERVKGEQNISKLTLEVARHKLAKLGYINLMYNADTTNFVEVDKRTIVSDEHAHIPKALRPWERHV